MNNIETPSGNDDRDANWGFLEDMASIGRLDMVLGDVDMYEPTPEATLPEETSDQE